MCFHLLDGLSCAPLAQSSVEYIHGTLKLHEFHFSLVFFFFHYVTHRKEVGQTRWVQVNFLLCLQDDSDNLPCARPDAMSEETLTQALESRGLDASGTAQERVARLELADRSE